MSEPSLWQQQGEPTAYPSVSGDLAVDVLVVGAGVTGCACAHRLARQGLDVAVLEGREVAAGASGRNGAFASTGTALGFDTLIERVGLDTAVDLYRLTEAAMSEMLGLARAAGAAEAVRTTGSLWLAGDDEVDALTAAVTAMSDAGIRCRIDVDAVPDRMRRWYRLAAVAEADGALRPAEWVRALARAAAAEGATICEHSPVSAIAPDASGWTLTLAGGRTAHAPIAVIACDGLIPALVPELDQVVYPVRGQVLATEPLEHTVITRPTHSDHGFYYYRPTSDGRVALGGGRITDMDAEYTDREETTPTIQAALDTFLEERLGIPATRVAHRWAGIMGFSADMLPVVGELPGRPGLWVCGGYSGVGNVPGFAYGRLLADRIAGAAHTSVSRVLDISRFGNNGAWHDRQRRCTAWDPHRPNGPASVKIGAWRLFSSCDEGFCEGQFALGVFQVVGFGGFHRCLSPFQPRPGLGGIDLVG